ncbi:MAG: hypothetical protein A4E71_02716 [Smithella sp. PtaU1.Bin162]|nr:MAG: hypothetical protein A4E71_02716 [Smithella sp. PtaU1.Bin162]
MIFRILCFRSINCRNTFPFRQTGLQNVKNIRMDNNVDGECDRLKKAVLALKEETLF